MQSESHTQVNLTSENLAYITNTLQDQFESKLVIMLASVVKAFTPELIPQIAYQIISHMADELKELETHVLRFPNLSKTVRISLAIN